MISSDMLPVDVTSTAVQAQHHPNDHQESPSTETMRKAMVLRHSLSEGGANKMTRDDRLVRWPRKRAAKPSKRGNLRRPNFAARGRQVPALHCCCIGQDVFSVIEKLDTIFHPRFQHYSPRQGLIFRCNGFVDDLCPSHHKGRNAAAAWKHEPAAKLTQQLFYCTPEGRTALRPCHGNHSRLGAHLSAGMVGEILKYVEGLKKNLAKFKNRRNAHMIQEDLSQHLASMIGMNNDFKWVHKQLEGQVHKAQIQLIAAENTLADHDPTSTTSRPRLNVLIAKQNLHTAQDALHQEVEERMKLANNLAASFLAHELGYGGSSSSDLPKFSTIALLLAHMWYERSDEDKPEPLLLPESLEDYLKAMSQLGALACPLEEALRMIRAPSTFPLQ